MNSNTFSMKSEDLIEKVQCYFFQDESLSKKFENFVNKNCHVIDLSNDEHKLVYTEIYNEYKDMLEETLEKYIESLGCTIFEFYKAISQKTEDEPNSSVAAFGQIMASVVEFDIFMVMMREAAQAQKNNRK